MLRLIAENIENFGVLAGFYITIPAIRLSRALYFHKPGIFNRELLLNLPTMPTPLSQLPNLLTKYFLCMTNIYGLTYHEVINV